MKNQSHLKYFIDTAKVQHSLIRNVTKIVDLL